MKSLSKIFDEFLQADNILIEMSIEEYLNIARKIINNNEYQRNRVRSSLSIYSLLRNDLKKLCTMPTIVLAFKDEGIAYDEGEEVFVNFVDNLMIMDGLQRTYSLIDVYNELAKENTMLLERFKNHKIRVEVYMGISRTGILYRMLTLNTGQIPMSKRHEIEILYSDYQSLDFGDEIHLNTETSVNNSTKVIGTYNFNYAIEGLCSLIEGDESQLTKKDLLVTVQQLDKVCQNDYQKDLFRQFLITYNSFAKQLDKLTEGWHLRSINTNKSIKSFYAKDIPDFMNKAQTFSAFGAAMGCLFDYDAYSKLVSLETFFSNLQIGSPHDIEFFDLLLDKMEYIKHHAKRIGDGQRKYLKWFFMNLFNNSGSTYLNLCRSVEMAFKQYKEEEEHGTNL